MNGLKIFIKPAKQIKFGFNLLRFFCNSFSNFFLLNLLLIIIFLNFPFNFKPDAVELFEIIAIYQQKNKNLHIYFVFSLS